MDNVAKLIRYHSKSGSLRNVYIFGSSSMLNSPTSVPPKDIDVILIKDSFRGFSSNTDLKKIGWVPASSDKEFHARHMAHYVTQVWVFHEKNFLEMLQAHIPVAMECVFSENPLTPKVPWTNKINFRSRVTIDPLKLYNSFTTVAIQHWNIASQLLIFNFSGAKAPEAHYNIVKKFSYAIRYLDFGRQLLKNGKIDDFSLVDEIRTKINDNTLSSEEDFFNIFVTVWNQFRACIKNLCLDERLDNVRRGILLRKKAIEDHLRSLQIKTIPEFHVENSSPLPTDIWTEIFLQITNPTDLSNISQVCKLWHTIINSRQFIDKLLIPYTGIAKEWQSNSEAIKYFKLASFFRKFEPYIPWKCVLCKEYPRLYSGRPIVTKFDSLYDKYTHYTLLLPPKSNNNVLIFGCGCQNAEFDWYNVAVPVYWGCVRPDILPLLRTAQLNVVKKYCPFCGSMMKDVEKNVISSWNMYMCYKGHLIGEGCCK